MIEMERLYESEICSAIDTKSRLTELPVTADELGEAPQPTYEELYVAAHEATRQTYQHDAGNIDEEIVEKRARRLSRIIGASVGVVALTPTYISMGLTVENSEAPHTWRQAIVPTLGVVFCALAIKAGRRAAKLTYDNEQSIYQQNRTEYLKYADNRDAALLRLNEYSSVAKAEA